MSAELESLTIEDLQQEILKRREAERAELRKRLEEARKRVRDLEAQIGDPVPSKPSAARAKAVPAAQRRDAILAALGEVSSASTAVLLPAVGGGIAALRETMDGLVQEGAIVREGNKRSTVYRLAA